MQVYPPNKCLKNRPVLHKNDAKFAIFWQIRLHMSESELNFEPMPTMPTIDCETAQPYNPGTIQISDSTHISDIIAEINAKNYTDVSLMPATPKVGSTAFTIAYKSRSNKTLSKDEIKTLATIVSISSLMQLQFIEYIKYMINLTDVNLRVNNTSIYANTMAYKFNGQCFIRVINLTISLLGYSKNDQISIPRTFPKLRYLGLIIDTPIRDLELLTDLKTFILFADPLTQAELFYNCNFELPSLIVLNISCAFGPKNYDFPIFPNLIKLSIPQFNGIDFRLSSDLTILSINLNCHVRDFTPYQKLQELTICSFLPINDIVYLSGTPMLRAIEYHCFYGQYNPYTPTYNGRATYEQIDELRKYLKLGISFHESMQIICPKRVRNLCDFVEYCGQRLKKAQTFICPGAM